MTEKKPDAKHAKEAKKAPEPITLAKGHISCSLRCGFCGLPVVDPAPPPMPHNMFIGLLTANWRAHVLTCARIKR